MSITTTERWQQEVAKQFRYPGKARMVMELVSDVSKADVEATAQNVLPITSVDTTLDSQSPEYNEIATMEGIWRADGTMYLPSRVPGENLPLPLMSETKISDATPLVLFYKWAQPASFIGLTFNWDNTYNSWPSELTVIGYASDGSEKYNSLVDTIVESNSVIEVPMDDVVAVRVIVTKWSKENLRARLSEILFGVVLEFNDNTLMSIEETTKQYFMCSSLPVDTQKYKIKNQIYRNYSIEAYSAVANKSHPLTDISRIFSSLPASKGIASVESRYWKADGELFLPSRVIEENPDIPWMSVDNNFSATDPIEIVITYEHPVQLNSINITWDAVTNSWPTDATVEGRDSNDATVFNKQINAYSVVTSITDIVATVKTVHIFIRAWSNPEWRARIGQYEASMVYGNNNIPSEVNNLFDPTLETGYSKYLARRQKITVQYGIETYDEGTLWMPVQTRFLDAWNIPTDAINIELESNTRLSFLTQDYKRGVYSASGESFYNLALSVLENSNVIKDRLDTEPWELDSVLSTLYTNAPLPVTSENALLQLIAGATGCVLGTKPTNGYITISSSLFESPYIIDKLAQLQTPGVTLDTTLRSISVNLYNYTVSTEETELFNGSISISGTKRVTISYKNNVCATNCSVVVSGATVGFQVFYGYYAVLELTATAQNTTVSVVIKGHEVASNSVQVTTFTDTTVESGRDIVIDNSLITNMDTLNVVANRAYEYYKLRNTATTKYLGYPDLKAGDKCAMYSQYFNGNGYVTEHTFSYNGGFNGNVKMLMEV